MPRKLTLKLCAIVQESSLMSFMDQRKIEKFSKFCLIKYFFKKNLLLIFYDFFVLAVINT